MSKKITFNVLDFIIVLFSFLTILAVIFWKDIRADLFQNEIEAEYTFIARGITEDMLSALEENDNLYISSDGTKLGKIVHFEKENELLPVVLVDGSVEKYESETYTIKGKVKAGGYEKENGFYVDNKYFMVAGKKFNVETSRIRMDIEIVELIMN